MRIRMTHDQTFINFADTVLFASTKGNLSRLQARSGMATLMKPQGLSQNPRPSPVWQACDWSSAVASQEQQDKPAEGKAAAAGVVSQN